MWRSLAAIAAFSAATPALAGGPPYDTDDPEPTDFRHWEIYGFATGARANRAFEGAAGFDLNYGPMPDVQLTATLPLDFVRGAERTTHVGDVEIGVKYRFLHDERAGVSLAIFPRVILPSSGRRYGSGRTGVLLPLWGQKDMGKWSAFGGGGYALNPGAGNRSYWVGGATITREVTPRLSLGIEATARGRDADDGRATKTLGVGGIYRLKGPLSLLASAGPSFAGRDGDKYHAYLALALNL